MSDTGLGSQPHTSDDGNERESARMWTSVVPSTNPATPGTWTLAWRSSTMTAPAFWYGYESRETAIAVAALMHEPALMDSFRVKSSGLQVEKSTSSQVDTLQERAGESLSSRDVARLLSWAAQVELAASRQIERLPGRGDTGVETALMYLRRVQTIAGDLERWLRVGLESEPVPLLIEGRDGDKSSSRQVDKSTSTPSSLGNVADTRAREEGGGPDDDYGPDDVPEVSHEAEDREQEDEEKAYEQAEIDYREQLIGDMNARGV